MNERLIVLLEIGLLWTGIVASAALALAIVGLVQGGGSSPSEPDQRVATCYDLMTRWLDAEEGSDEDFALDDKMDDEDCFE